MIRKPKLSPHPAALAAWSALRRSAGMAALWMTAAALAEPPAELPAELSGQPPSAQPAPQPTSESAADPAIAGLKAAKTVPAIWKEQDVTFFFQSFSVFYSCQSLESKVERLLAALGATKGTKVRVTGCEGSHIARSPYLRVDLVSPVEVTPEVQAELNATRSQRELVARVNPMRPLQDSEPFPAQWRRVALTTRGKLDLDPGDCELLEQLKRNVLPKLAVRVIKDDLNCMSNQLAWGQPQLEVEALVRVPKQDADVVPKSLADDPNSTQ